MPDSRRARSSRRAFLEAAAGFGALASLAPATRALAAEVGSSKALGFAPLPSGTLAEELLYRLPGKVPLIKKSFRPPNFETPISYFREVITPNDAFFVRWHLAGIPEKIDARQWSLHVGGDAAEREVKIDFDQLRKEFKPHEVIAVNQCSGNRRGLSEPHVAGVEWGVGAMGNARWRGARLRDILDRAGVKGNALEVAFNGAEGPVIPKTPDFVKSLPMDKVRDPDTIVAYEMNGHPLPHWNGFPARLIVPGWTGTYWVKMLIDVNVRSTPQKDFWMAPAYRVPRGMFPTPTFESQLYAPNEPITTMVVNSLITSLHAGQQIPRGKPIAVRGLAWDGGWGIAKVEVSVDTGKSWHAAKLGRDLGRYSFREFSFDAPTRERGSTVVMARAISRRGETQVEKLKWNGAGYHNNVIQRIYVEIV